MSIFLSLIALAVITVIIMVNIGDRIAIGKTRETRDEKIKRIMVQKLRKPIQIKAESNKNNEEIISWNKAFLKSLEWKRYEDVCMEYLRIKNCDANVTCTGADGGIDIKVCDKNGNMLAIGQCKAWNKPILV